MYDDEFMVDEPEFEFESEYGEEFEDEWEYDPDQEFEEEFEWETGDSPFSSSEEMQLASELLSVTDEQELEQFLGKLVKRAWSKAKKFAKSSTGRALGGILKAAAKKALPIIGTAAGTALGGPAGGALGGKLASLAGRTFGLELEGLSPEDQEFEVARRFVRFAGSAAKKAAHAPSSAPARAVAKAAVKAAAAKHAPGLIRSNMPAYRLRSRHGGRWVRRGRNIVLFNA